MVYSEVTLLTKRCCTRLLPVCSVHVQRRRACTTHFNHRVAPHGSCSVQNVVNVGSQLVWWQQESSSLFTMPLSICGKHICVGPPVVSVKMVMPILQSVQPFPALVRSATSDFEQMRAQYQYLSPRLSPQDCIWAQHGGSQEGRCPLMHCATIACATCKQTFTHLKSSMADIPAREPIHLNNWACAEDDKQA